MVVTTLENRQLDLYLTGMLVMSKALDMKAERIPRGGSADQQLLQKQPEATPLLGPSFERRKPKSQECKSQFVFNLEVDRLCTCQSLSKDDKVC